jgi:hypothetical protein
LNRSISGSASQFFDRLQNPKYNSAMRVSDTELQEAAILARLLADIDTACRGMFVGILNLFEVKEANVGSDCAPWFIAASSISSSTGRIAGPHPFVVTGK